MNKNIVQIAILILALLVALIIISNVLSGQGSNISALAQYFAFASLILGFFLRTTAIYVLVVYAALSDLLKRALILENTFTQLDITYILMMSPLLMTGLFLGCIMDCFLKQKLSKPQKLALVVGMGLGLLNLAMNNFMGRGFLGILQLVANVFSYFFLPFCVITTFPTLDKYINVIKFACLIFVLVAIHGMRQFHYGFPDFEYDYLASGFTSIVNSYDIDSTRPFSTLASPGAFAYCCGLLATTCFLFAKTKNRIMSNGTLVKFMPLIITILVFLLLYNGALVSKSRTQILVTTAIIPFFFLIKSKKLTYVAYSIVFTIILFVFTMSGYILENDLITQYQNNIAFPLANKLGIDQRYLTLSTMTVRVEGWNSLVTNPEYWKPFGNPEIVELQENLTMMQAKVAGVRSHDKISEMLLKVGYIPLTITSLLGLWVLRKLHNWLTSLHPKSFESRSSRIGILAVFSAYGATLAGGAMTAFPVPLILNIVFAMCFFQTNKQSLEPNTI